MPVAYRDYYKTLGLKKTASNDEIKKAYRKLARQFHPDINKGAEAERRFKEINEANEVLSDPGKRGRYDQLGPDWERYAAAGHQGGSNGGPGAGYQWTYKGAGRQSPFGDAETAGFSEFFRTLFADQAGATAPGTRRSRRSRAGEDIEYELTVSLLEAYRGGERQLELRLDGGESRTLNVKIPAGVRDGQRIRLAGQGGAGVGGGPAGDLYLRLKVQKHPLFTRDGDDLRADVPIALHEALLGAEISVPTLKGRVSLRIPPETQNGRTIRLAGQGMPRTGGGFGDLYLTVRVVLPQKLTEPERELIKTLAAGRAEEDPRAHLI